MSILAKIWSIGEKLLADDLNNTFNSLFKRSYTASGDILKNDAVYINASDTVKKFYPSAMGTGSAIATSTSMSYNSNRSVPLSTNGLYLHINGGDIGTAAQILAVLRTMNAGETDFASTTTQTIYSTGNGCNAFDIKQIGTDKFLLIFQANTAGGPAGIKVVVVSVSGSTITVGSIVTIETTGSLSSQPSCAKLDTDKAIIFYKKDSDSKLYSQVLTVSGTTISTNTPVNVNNTLTSAFITQAVQLATDSVAIVYGDGSGGGAALYGRTVSVSGTTPTINAEQTLITQASSTWKIGLLAISANKLLLAYSENSSSTNDQLAHIAISGSTMTKSSNISLGSTRSTRYFGMIAITTKYAMVFNYVSTINARLYFIDTSGSAPTQISTQDLNHSNNSNIYLGYNIVKVAPWVYVTNSGGGAGDSDYIVKLTPASTLKIGIAENDIADTVAGNIIRRFCLSDNFTGLTAGSAYYVDDDGQPTLKSSSVSPVYGYSVSSTKMELQ